MSWNERLDLAIDLPNGKMLQTLEDARLYILQLPKAEVESIACQIAIEALLIAAAKPDHSKRDAQDNKADHNSSRASASPKSWPRKKVPEQIHRKRIFHSS